MTQVHPTIQGILEAHGAPKPADTYRGWTIHQGRWPEPAWMAESPNYDASYEGEEDGWVDNGEKADAGTREALIEEIDAWFEEHGTSASVDTHAERCDVKQAQPARVGSAVAATSGETPKPSQGAEQQQCRSGR